MLQRASEAIDRPRYDDIELAPAGFLVHGVEAGALVAALGTADPRHPMHCRAGMSVIQFRCTGGPDWNGPY